MRVLICGDRHWTDRECMEREMARHPITVVIEGEQRGADKMSRAMAESQVVPVEPYPADWDRYGKAAGPIRNTQMLREGKPDLVIAFHDDLAHSKGTKDMIRQALKAEVPVIAVGFNVGEAMNEIFASLNTGNAKQDNLLRFLDC